MGRMRVLNEKGDIVISWDPNDSDSVKNAADEFKRLKEDGYEIFEVEKVKKGKKLSRFKKTAGELIATPGIKTASDKAKGTRPKASSGGPIIKTVGA